MVEINEVWLIDYARTAFSRCRPRTPERDVFGEIRGDELLAQLLMKFFDEKLADKGIEKKDIEESSVGVAAGVGEGWTYGGRLPIFMAGFPPEVPAFFIDRQCGSAGSGMHVGIMEIMTGNAKITLANGFEHMGRGRGTGASPNMKLNDKNSKYYRPDLDMPTTFSMLQTAQKLYEQEVPTFTKEDLDKFGVRSHNLTVKSHGEGWFKGEIIPIEGHVEGDANT
ncbi:MAG: acetyl-CoA C-acyltransferase, partial [Promethearchaeota archaeon]